MSNAIQTETSDTPLATEAISASASIWNFMLRFQGYFGLLAILLISTLLSPTRDGTNIFLGSSNLLNIARFASENGIIAIGMTLVILTAGIDLSVGAVLALCAVGAAACLTRYHLDPFLSIFLMLGLGAIIGAINGLITTRLAIQSFITTLAMMSAARGAASLWANGYAIPLQFGTAPGDAPPLFKSLFSGQIVVGSWEIPAQIFYFIGAGVLATLLLRRTGFGRHVYAVGSNETAARLSGVNVARVKVIVFAISGFLSGLAALLHASLVNQGSHIDGAGYELNAIAAVVIGGTSLSGGSGTIVGSMVGALILSMLDNILGLHNIDSNYQLILKGAIIILAVVLQRQRK
ncbi:MAG: ribose transport system permease protein [Abditibacteriota bacterium]|nr:ribose transport system permease protein [Abditibacteriota bacterium]